MGSSLKSARFLIESRLRDAARGDANACYDLGMVYSSGADGIGGIVGQIGAGKRLHHFIIKSSDDLSL